MIDMFLQKNTWDEKLLTFGTSKWPLPFMSHGMSLQPTNFLSNNPTLDYHEITPDAITFVVIKYADIIITTAVDFRA